MPPRKLTEEEKELRRKRMQEKKEQQNKPLAPTGQVPVTTGNIPVTTGNMPVTPPNSPKSLTDEELSDKMTRMIITKKYENPRIYIYFEIFDDQTFNRVSDLFSFYKQMENSIEESIQFQIVTSYQLPFQSELNFLLVSKEKITNWWGYIYNPFIGTQNTKDILCVKLHDIPSWSADVFCEKILKGEECPEIYELRVQTI